MDQLRNLFEGAGFDLSRVIDTPSSMHIVDGLPPQGWASRLRRSIAGPSQYSRSSKTLRPA